MHVKMVTYDSEYGDAIQFDHYKISADSFGELSAMIQARFRDLIGQGALRLDEDGDFTNVVDARSGKTVETYLIAYRSEQDLEGERFGLELASGIFYTPQPEGLSWGEDAGASWDYLNDLDQDVVDYWNLQSVIDAQPPELDGTRFLSGGEDAEPVLASYLFRLYQSRR
jgi:hypothetical protein